MSELYTLPCLENRYFAMRHGHSKANEQSLIVSDPVLGVNSYGLTALGQKQVRTRLTNMPPSFDASVKIVSSDFLRARETAAIIAAGLGVIEPVRFSEQLRERFFGEFEGRSDTHYPEVWGRDAVNAHRSDFGVEPVFDVIARTLALVLELETLFREAVVLLVAHGDVLQILQTVFEQCSPSLHRQLPPLQVAEVRPLVPRLPS
ncbi:MAG: histidine phosphatase family protein [Halioglobus sp.]